MATDNIFSGLKVVDLASFIAGPSAAVKQIDSFIESGVVSGQVEPAIK